MIGRLLQYLVFRLVRLFYKGIEVHGTIPKDGPVIFVLNHPNKVLDPVLLMAVCGRPITFLAKSTVFAHPVQRWAVSRFGALPICRPNDIGKPGGALDSEDMSARNEATFARCRELLRKGRPMALFPEGVSHDAPQLLPLRSGAARIALTTAEAADWKSDVVVLPVGIWYERMTRFRTRAALSVGEVHGVDAYQRQYADDAREAVRDLTVEIKRGLDKNVLQAESARLLRAVPILAAWTAPKERAKDLAWQLNWSSRLLSAYNSLSMRDPERVEKIKKLANQYGSLLQAAGVSDPWKLELPLITWQHLMRRALWLSLLLLPAIIGTVLSWLPYRLSGIVTRRVLPHDRTQVGTMKLLSGTALMIIWWVIAAIIVSIGIGFAWGVGLLLAAPACTYAVLRWSEIYRSTHQIITYSRLRKRHVPLVTHLAECKRELAVCVHDALAIAEADG